MTQEPMELTMTSVNRSVAWAFAWQTGVFYQWQQLAILPADFSGPDQFHDLLTQLSAQRLTDEKAFSYGDGSPVAVGCECPVPGLPDTALLPGLSPGS